MCILRWELVCSISSSLVGDVCCIAQAWGQLQREVQELAEEKRSGGLLEQQK